MLSLVLLLLVFGERRQRKQCQTQHMKSLHPFCSRTWLAPCFTFRCNISHGDLNGSALVSAAPAIGRVGVAYESDGHLVGCNGAFVVFVVSVFVVVVVAVVVVV